MYQLIDNIPVWGDHEESTINQIKRCASDDYASAAALLADGHLGYSMPIGGVVAYHEAVSPSGVGYDIACLASGTPVTTGDGYFRNIEDVTAHHPAMCWDGERLRTISSLHGAIPRGIRRVYTLALMNGRTIEGTSDHQVRTKAEWKSIADLTPDDRVACNPFIGMPYVPESRDLELDLPGVALRADLASRNLSPVNTSSPLFPILLRLVAYVSGDGHLTKNGRRVSIYTTCEHDAEAIARDFARLGFTPHVYRRFRAIGRQDEIHVCVDSKALHALFAALGSPVGTKAWPEDPMPWLFASAPWVRAHFLSAFCSAEMMTPRPGPRGWAPNLQLKQAGANRNAIDFVARLFDSLGYEVSVATSGPSRAERSDYVLQVLGGLWAQIRFFEEIGFCYAYHKRVAAASVSSAGWAWLAAVEYRTEAQSLARALHASGVRSREVIGQVTARYAVAPQFAHHAMYGNRGKPSVLPGASFPADTTGEICWVPVVGRTEGRTVPVWDVVTGDHAHSFLARGLVVHNCGLKGVRTNLRAQDVRPRVGGILDDIQRTIAFGVGRTSGKNVDHPIFDDPTWQDIRPVWKLRQMAQQQLGTVGSGNHFVDLLEDEEGWLWVSAHFGSRGLGHRTASGYLNLAAGRAFDAKAPGESMDQPATVLSLDSPLGQEYLHAMELAGKYAYAGRDYVVGQVLGILGTTSTEEVHNHHNFAWKETHNGEELHVVRKGATPAWPGQRGFIGGSMGDISVVVEGVDDPEAQAALRSTIHGAGRVMSRRRAAGRIRYKKNADG
nr:RtcB family protein [Chloroflexia bacterium]